MNDDHKLSRTTCSLFLVTLLIANTPMWAADGHLKNPRGTEGQLCAAFDDPTEPAFLLEQGNLSRALRETAIPDVYDVLAPGADDWVELGEFRLLKRMPYSPPDSLRSDYISDVTTFLMFGEFTTPSGETEFLSATSTAARDNPLRDSNGATLTAFSIVDRSLSASDMLALTESLSYYSALQSMTKAEPQLDALSFDGGIEPNYMTPQQLCVQGCQATYRQETFLCRTYYTARNIACDVAWVACLATCCSSILVCPRCYRLCTTANAACLDLSNLLLGSCYSNAGQKLNRCMAGCGTPIIVDVDGRANIKLSGPNDGVAFDLDTDGQAEQLAWTLEGTGDAFLALDRNGNGRIDNGGELFGGFEVLIELDTPILGGNGNNLIDPGDSVFDNLLFWVDANHNGVSEAEELKTVASEGLQWIDLDYVENNRRDRHGNLFRYNTNVRLTVNGHERNVRASDVFLVVQGQ